MGDPHRQVIDSETRRSADGRLVQRYRTVGLHLTWHPPTRRLLRTRPVAAPAEVIDVSEGGALLLADAFPAIRPGLVVAVELDSSRGLVEVRHVHDAHHPEQRYYGVHFVEQQPGLRARIAETVARQRGVEERFELAWRSGT
jgi:hypothetical protein